MRIAANLATQEFIEMYKFHMKIIRGIYGLPQAGRLANDLLKQCLAEEDYFEVDYVQAFSSTSGHLFGLP